VEVAKLAVREGVLPGPRQGARRRAAPAAFAAVWSYVGSYVGPSAAGAGHVGCVLGVAGKAGRTKNRHYRQADRFDVTAVLLRPWLFNSRVEGGASPAPTPASTHTIGAAAPGAHGAPRGERWLRPAPAPRTARTAVRHHARLVRSTGRLIARRRAPRCARTARCQRRGGGPGLAATRSAAAPFGNPACGNGGCHGTSAASPEKARPKAPNGPGPGRRSPESMSKNGEEGGGPAELPRLPTRGRRSARPSPTRTTAPGGSAAGEAPQLQSTCKTGWPGLTPRPDAGSTMDRPAEKRQAARDRSRSGPA
jgi:hypothetical protein